MKRTLSVAILSLVLLASGIKSTAQDTCTPCLQRAQYEFNVAFNSCRDHEGCSDPDCSNCVGEGTSAKYDYVNSSCPVCGNLSIDGKK